MQTFLHTPDDMEWLKDGGINVDGATCAVLYGNEGWPDKVEIYAENHYQCVPTVWLFDENGKPYRAGQ